MWSNENDRLALLELLSTGGLRRRRAQEAAFTVLAGLPWVRRTRRRDELALVEAHRSEIEKLLDRVWSDWRTHLAELAARGLAPTPDGWQELADARRAITAGSFPARLNRRTAIAAVGPHSKATLSARRRAVLGTSDVMHDGIVRLRPVPGLRVQKGDVDLDAVAVADLLGELALTERALRDGTHLAGPLDVVLLVENLGAYRDLVAPAGWVVVHVAGWDTATLRVFVDGLPQVRIAQFGDLDPNGVRVAHHLRGIRADVRWLVPDLFAGQMARALKKRWPKNVNLDGAPTLVQELARSSLWLEQETIVLDPRLSDSLQRALALHPASTASPGVTPP